MKTTTKPAARKRTIVAVLGDRPVFAGHKEKEVLTRLTIKDSYCWSGIGYVAKGESGRQEFGGPLVPGPWAFGFGLSHVMDNHGGTGAEMARLREQGLLHEVAGGERIRVAGTLYEVRIERRGRDAWVHLDNVVAKKVK